MPRTTLVCCALRSAAVAVMLPLMLAATDAAAEVLNVERGIYDDYELLIVECDRAPEFRLTYDRVAGEVLLAVNPPIFGEQVMSRASGFVAGASLAGMEIDPETGQLIFKTGGAVRLTPYVVNGPSALILEVGRSPNTAAPLPYEMGENDYLLRGGIEEREGRLQKALEYIERARAAGQNDAALDHRAGIIEHQLGRFDAALETFARTGNNPELAADAHARSAMILLKEGDSTAAGRSWADYFRKGIKPDTLATPAKVASVGREVATEDTESETNKSAGMDAQPMTLAGWIVLGLGVLTLAGLVAKTMGDSRSLSGVVLNGNSNGRGYAAPTAPAYRFDLQPLNLDLTRAPHSADWHPNLRSSEPAFLGRNSGLVRRGGTGGPRPIPSDAILRRAREGRDELDIAREFGVARDEVAMVMNLARLARERRN